MPSGKVSIQRASQWRANLSREIAILNRWPPYDDIPDPDQRKLLRAVHRSRVSYAINVRSARKYASDEVGKPTVAEIRRLRSKLREAVRQYQVTHASPIPTPTARRTTLNAVKTAAGRLLGARAGGGWAGRLASGLQKARDVDQDLERRLAAIIIRGTGQRVSGLASLTGELEALAATSIAPGAEERQKRFIGKWSPHLEILNSLNVDALAPKRARWPDPALPGLVFALVPLWRHITGRSCLATEMRGTKHPKEHPLFGVWTAEIVCAAGLWAPGEWAVWDIANRAEFQKIPSLEEAD
jgi:hypothetical protein